MKLFMKLLDSIVYGFIVFLLASLFLGGVVGSIYGIVWSWTTETLEHEMPISLFITIMCLIGFFTTLVMVYLTLDDVVNSKPIIALFTPKPIQSKHSQQTQKKSILP